MCSLVKFPGKDFTDFEEQALPTLDTSQWIEGDKVKYTFFEQPTAPNRVLLKITALSDSCLRSTLVQEVVRRYMNMSEDLEIKKRQEVMSVFAQKMSNSGYTESEIKSTIVQGAVTYINNRELASKVRFL